MRVGADSQRLACDRKGLSEPGLGPSDDPARTDRLKRGHACARTAPENTKFPIRPIVDWRTQMRVGRPGARRIRRAVYLARANLTALRANDPYRSLTLPFRGLTLLT